MAAGAQQVMAKMRAAPGTALPRQAGPLPSSGSPPAAASY